MSMKQISLSIGILVAIVGSVIGINEYFAKADDLRLVEYRLEQKILNDRYEAIQQRIWQLEDRYGENCNNQPQEIRNEIRKLEQELKRIERELEKKG